MLVRAASVGHAIFADFERFQIFRSVMGPFRRAGFGGYCVPVLTASTRSWL